MGKNPKTFFTFSERRGVVSWNYRDIGGTNI